MREVGREADVSERRGSARATHESFRSEAYRCDYVREVREGRVAFFRELSVQSDDVLLRMTLRLPFAPNVKTELLYHNKTNDHVVLRLSTGAHAVVWKLCPMRLHRNRTATADNGREARDDEIEVRYLKIGEELIRRSICPYFVLAIGCNTLTMAELRPLFREGFFTTRHTHCLSLLAEACDSDLTQLLFRTKLTEYQLTSLVLQALLTLLILQDIFNTFRHNDAHAGNWLVQKLEVRRADTVVRHCVHGVCYTLDIAACPYRLLLWDMHFASMSARDANGLELLVPRNKELIELKDEQQTRTRPNRYYDLHAFVDSVEHVLRKVPRKIAPSLQDFIDRVVPPALKCLSRDKMAWTEGVFRTEHTTPARALEHEIFDVFRRPHPRPSTLVREYVYPVPLT